MDWLPSTRARGIARIVTVGVVWLLSFPSILAQAQPSIVEAWIEAPAAGGTIARAFLTVRNPGMYDVWIVSATTEVAARVELRQTTNGATAVPREIGVLPGGTLEMKAEGPHLALIGLTRALQEGETITLVIKTDLAEMNASAVVKPRSHEDEDAVLITIAAPDGPAAQEGTSLLGRPLTARASTPAVEQATAALDQAPNDVERLIAAAQALDSVWQFQRSIALYSRALTISPANVRALSYRGQRFLSTRRFADAIADLERARTLDPLSFDALYHLGLGYYFTGRFAAAADTFGRCLDAERDGAPQAALGHAPAEARSCSRLSEGLRFSLISWRYAALRREGRHADAKTLVSAAPPASASLGEGRMYADAVAFVKAEPNARRDVTGLTGTQVLTFGYPMANHWLANGDQVRGCALLKELVSRAEWPAFGLIAAEADLARGTCGPPAKE